MARLETLQDLLVLELHDLYNAENQILKALPKMARKATSAELRSAFEQHLEQTTNQVARLEQALQSLGEPVRGKRCEGMEGILGEGAEMMQQDAEDDVMDAALIAAAQKVEHYEIASYGAVCAWAEVLGLEELKASMGQTLDEEESTDARLSEIAEGLNTEAITSDDEEEAEEVDQATANRAATSSRKPSGPGRTRREGAKH